MSYKKAAAKDFFSLELQDPQGVALKSVDYDAQRFWVGEPGMEFQVAVNASIGSGMTYRVSLEVDGQGPGYSKLMYGGSKPIKIAVFTGWLASSGSTASASTSYRVFKFGSCTPSPTAATVSSPDAIAAGQIVIKLEQVVDSGRRQSSSLVAAAPSSAAISKKLPEGKKWFLAPGLKAEAGTAVAQSVNWDTTIWTKVGSLPDLKARYDSSEALYLRKALNPRFAPHRAILRRSANPAIAVLGAEPAAAAAAAAAAGRGGSSRQQDATARVKREAVGVKREREDEQGEEEYVPRSATAADRVDLTEEPVQPMTVNGRQLAPDELAVCDLCDSDDEGAAAATRWQVKKKHQIKVEL